MHNDDWWEWYRHVHSRDVVGEQWSPAPSTHLLFLGCEAGVLRAAPPGVYAHPLSIVSVQLSSERGAEDAYGWEFRECIFLPPTPSPGSAVSTEMHLLADPRAPFGAALVLPAAAFPPGYGCGARHPTWIPNTGMLNPRPASPSNAKVRLWVLP